MPAKTHPPQTKSSGLAMRGKNALLSSKPTVVQKRAEAYCRANPAWFLNKVERFYPLDEQLISKFEERWDWKSLSESNSLPWSEELIIRYADRLDWFGLSNNKSLPWTEEFIVRLNDMRESQYYELLSKDESKSLCLDSWCFESLSENESIPWSEALIARYAEEWNWAYILTNESIPWSKGVVALCHEFADPCDGPMPQYAPPAIPLTVSDMAKTKGKSEWANLSLNTALPWSVKLIAQYKDRWDWGLLSYNESLPWSEELIAQYKDRWEWGNLSFNESLPWSEEFIVRYKDRWEWKGLSQIEAIPWSEELINRFEGYWNFGSWILCKSLCENESIPWSEELIARYSDRWNWELLSKNTAVPASQNIIARFADKWESLRSTPLRKDDKEPVFGIFSPTPIFKCAGHDRPICFNLTKKQVESLIEECFKNPVAGREKKNELRA